MNFFFIFNFKKIKKIKNRHEKKYQNFKISKKNY